ncbi:class I SAM-dependent methyltransferase [Patescibacteria group bacterium]|nr:class I SAM-dependent methyltransferase [Patescibacteria group bacterium]MBU1916369.1 class I SAM-dependent methyltransferase [Patescibacteria group bacterium]
MNDKSSTLIGQAYDKIAGLYVAEAYVEDPSQESRNRFISLLPEHGRVLDIGCGGGQDSAGFEIAQLVVYGVDPSERMIELATTLVPSGHFQVAGFLTAELEAESFDGVWCSRVFHHVPMAEQNEFVQRMNLMLKPGGWLYLSVQLNEDETDEETWDVESGGTKSLIKTLGHRSWPAILKDNGFEVTDIRKYSTDGWVEAYAIKR